MSKEKKSIQVKPKLTTKEESFRRVIKKLPKDVRDLLLYLSPGISRRAVEIRDLRVKIERLMEYINERVDNTVSLMLKIDNLPSIAIDYRKSIYEQLRNDPDFLELDDTVKLLIKATLLSENASLNIITIGKAISERIRKGALED